MLDIQSKLPHVGTTIFTVITQRAQELNAISLAQGFPDYDPPERLKELIAKHLALGHNQYAPMTGVACLREEIARLRSASYGRSVDPDTQVTITLGATEALFSAVLALVHPGDEAIVLDPCYDSYGPAIELAGGRPVHVPLTLPDFSIDWQRLRDAVNARTRLIVVNSPHNPSGAVLSREDWAQLADLLRNTSAMVLSDEVYECMVFDGRAHYSPQQHAELAERTFSVYSFGKNVHATGYRVGYAIGPANMTLELRRVHQFNTFSITAPLQYALADFMRESPQHFTDLGRFYQRKRDRFLDALRGSRWGAAPSPGTYFQLLDYKGISKDTDVAVADWLLREVGVAAIPLAPFYAHPPQHTFLRFCFAKTDETLDRATEKLRRL